MKCYKSKRKIQTIQSKWIKDLNRHFTEETKMANKYMRTCPTLLVIFKIQIRVRMSFWLTPIRYKKIKKLDNNKYWQGCGTMGPLIL